VKSASSNLFVTNIRSYYLVFSGINNLSYAIIEQLISVQHQMFETKLSLAYKYRGLRKKLHSKFTSFN